MKKLRWQLVIILLTGLVVGGLLITQKPPSAQTTVASPEPTTGGSYTEGLVGAFKRFNPILDTYNNADRDVDRLVFSGLVRFDTRGFAEPDLAETYKSSEDGTIYNFALRKGLVWHDGKPITTEDVEFTYNLLKSDSSLVPEDLRKFWKEVTIDRLDDLTIQFKLPEAFAPFLDYLTVGILPKHLLGDLPLDTIVDSPYNLTPVGSGPYRYDHTIVENDQVVGVVLTAFDKYYGKKPFIEQVVFRYYPDSASAYQAYQAGQVQGISQVSRDILPQVLEESGLGLYTARQPDLSMVLMNLNNEDVPFFKDTKIRRALIMAINRQWIVDRLMGGQAIVADGPILPGTWAYYDGLEQIKYDKDAAIKLLKEDGYSLPAEGDQIWAKDGKSISFQMTYPDDADHQAIAEYIQQSWRDLGVQVSLEAAPYDQLVNDRLGQRNYQAALVDLNLTRLPDPDPYPFWDQEQITDGQNYSGWSNRMASEYIEQARITNDVGERTRLYRNFQALFVKDMPAIPLYYPVYTYAVDRQIQGVQVGPLFEPAGRFSTVEDWFLVAKKNQENAIAPSATP